MITTPRFVFLHLHKSGGTFANECLLKCIPGARRIGYHLPRALVPAGLQCLPVLGLVRNPWSYYVSWYCFQRERPRPNVLFRVLSAGGSLGFAGTVRNMLALGSGSPLLGELLQALPAAYGAQGLNLPSFALAPIRDSGLGFYSYLYSYLFAGAGPAPVIGRVDAMRTQLPAMLESVGAAVPPAMREFLAQEPPRNASAHTHYSDYYDQDLRALVGILDATIIGRHGYSFGRGCG